MLVTGRPLRWLSDVVDALGGVDALVIANGAVIYRLPNGRVDGSQELLRRHVIDPDDVVDWAVRLRAGVPGVMFGVECGTRFGAEPGFHPEPSRANVVVGSLPELLVGDPDVVKLMARVPVGVLAGDRPGDVLLAAARVVLSGRTVPVHSDSFNPLVEMGPPGIDKATGLQQIAELLGVERADVVAFGDMPNDVPMLSWAGRGYAMADGHADAIAAADSIARACVEDGVAAVLEELLTHRPAPARVVS